MKRALLIAMLAAAPAWAETPDGGANVSVVVEPDGSTTVDVKRGQLKVKSGGSETRVGAGESVRAQKCKPLKRVLAAAIATSTDRITSIIDQTSTRLQTLPGASLLTRRRGTTVAEPGAPAPEAP